MPHYRIAVLAGDGIGPEVIAEALKILDAGAVPGRLEFAFEEVEAGADCYRRTGEELPRETLDVCHRRHHPLRRRGAARRSLPGRNRDRAPAHASQRSRPPLATILSAALMLAWLGQRDGNDDATSAASRIEAAVDEVTRAGRVLTPDLGGPGTTGAVGDAVVAALVAAPDPA